MSSVKNRTWLEVFRVESWSAQGSRCRYCRDRLTRGEATTEHLLAKSRGGTDARHNIAASCQPCNSAKGAMSEHAFKRLVKGCSGHAPFAIRMAALRLRLNLRIEMACARVEGCVKGW